MMGSFSLTSFGLIAALAAETLVSVAFSTGGLLSRIGGLPKRRVLRGKSVCAVGRWEDLARARPLDGGMQMGWGLRRLRSRIEDCWKSPSPRAEHKVLLAFAAALAAKLGACSMRSRDFGLHEEPFAMS